MRFEDQRKQLVDRFLKGRDITDENVLNAFLEIPREKFIEPELSYLAYHDSPLTIGEGQTISQPYIVALMLQQLELKPTDRVLEIGTGSGYQTALLSKIVAEVYTVERIKILSLRAKAILEKLGCDNIFMHVGDGTLGWSGAEPNMESFDKIVVAAGAPRIPQALLEQLAEGGICVIPSGDRITQNLVLIKRVGDDYVKTDLGSCAFVPLIGKEGWQK